jgi:hypothetical protein
MATSDKDYQSEQVRQHTRMAAGAWIDGSDLKEKGSATMPKANSDHGNFSSNKSSMEGGLAQAKKK